MPAVTLEKCCVRYGVGRIPTDEETEEPDPGGRTLNAGLVESVAELAHFAAKGRKDE